MADHEIDMVPPLLALAQAGIPTDVQQLLIFGDPMRGIKPDALEKAIVSALAAIPGEPVGWLPTSTIKWLGEYGGPACAIQTAAHNRPIKTDGGVPIFTVPQPDRVAELEAEVQSLRKSLKESKDESLSLYRIIADIRHKTGVGDKPMLSELANAIATLAQEPKANGR